MNSVIPFAFENHLVRALWRGAEPWFVGQDVCGVLGLAKPENALSSLDEDERSTLNEGVISELTGRRAFVIISEPGVYRLVFRSRKPEAERFKRWLAHDVLPQLRRTGRYAPQDPEYAADPGSDASAGPRDPASEPLLHRLHMIRECRAIHGRAVAAIMWRKLGLPAVPPPPPGPAGEARQLFRHILDAQSFGSGPRIRDLVELALAEDEAARLQLMASGVRVDADRELVVIGNHHVHIQGILRATEWSGQSYWRLLRHVPEAVATKSVRFGPLVMRGTAFPAASIDA